MARALLARMVRRPLAAALRLDERGVAAVEFALLLPLMVTLYLGSVEVSQALSTDRKVVLLSRTLADLTTQQSSVDAAKLTNVTGAAKVVMAPVSTTPLTMRLTSIAISPNPAAPTDPAQNFATSCWSYVVNGTGAGATTLTAYTRGKRFATTEVPVTLRTDTGTSLVLAEVLMPYKPVIGYVLTGTLQLNEKIFMRPRVSTYVTKTDQAVNSGVPLAADNGECK